MTEELVQREEWGVTTAQAIPAVPGLIAEGGLARPEIETEPSQEFLREMERKCLRMDHGGKHLLKALDASDYYEGDDLAVNVVKSKYLAPGETGPFHMWDRIARAIATVESNRDYWYHQFMSILIDFKFVPGGRVMHAAGREDARRRPTLSNCYVIPIVEDSLEAIYTCLMESALVYRTGGGVGTDLSILRPEGAPVNATVDKSPGSTAFMNLLSESTNTVSQAGRRGALMLTLRVDHPDIERFITIKNDPERRKVQYANISVLATHEFMQAVLNDDDFPLRWGGKVFRTVKARDLWKKMIENAHASAEPGVIFWDTMREYHNLEYANPLSSTNPCGEQPLAAYTACNLGSLNLTSFVREDGSFDYVDLAETTRVATRFLDDVIDYNMDNHALDKIKEAVASDRRVGLGITGLADALVCMKIRYDSDEALQAVDKMMSTIRDAAYRTSVDLAREKGPFPVFNWEGYSRSRFVQALPEEIRNDIERFGIRNGTVITVPPVGTGSIVARSSSGVEPIFCTSYKRRVKNSDGESFVEYKVYHHLIQRLFGGDDSLPPYVVTAHDIDPYFRVKMQGVIQNYVDSAISSTVNLAEDVSVETVADIYLTAYKAGLKGITVYREGSRQGILQTDAEGEKAEGATPAEESEASAALIIESKGNGNGSEAAHKSNGNGFHPRTRPSITHGVTERIRTGEGNLYITINEDSEGLCEVFTTIGKAGGNAQAQSEAISRLISLALRAGIDPREIIQQLKGISGPLPVWENGELILSTPDAIGKALERHLGRQQNVGKDLLLKSAAGHPKIPTKAKSDSAMPGNGHDSLRPLAFISTCPECGGGVAHETGCVTCYHCGWSRC